MSQRRTVAVVVAAIVMAAAAGVLYYLYEVSRADLLARADNDLRQVAGEAANAANGLFHPAWMAVQQLTSAKLDHQSPADVERRFFDVAGAVLNLTPQIAGLSLGRADGAALLMQNLVPIELKRAGVLAENYRGFVRRSKAWTAPGWDRWSYWDIRSREWVETPTTPAQYDPRTRPWYEDAVANDLPVWSKPYVFAASGEVGVTLGVPIRDDSGELWGVVGVDFALGRLSSLVFEYRKRTIGSDGFIFIGDEGGQMIGHSRLLDALAGLSDRSPAAVAHASSILNTHRENGDDVALFKAIQRDNQVYRAHNGDRDVMGIRLPLDPGLGLAGYVYVGEPVDGIVGRAFADLRRNLLILVGMTAMLLVVIFYAEKLRREVVERKQAQAALSQARDAAEAATRAKSSFLAMMSHEIRTPMNGVMSMADILDQTELNEDQRSMSRVIRQSAEALLTVINDILDFSKIEAGRLDLERIEFDIVELLESVGDLLAPRAEEKRLTLLVRVAPETPRIVIGDPNRVRQILLNLCGNALKFTVEGSVEMVMSGRQANGNWRARVEVIDTGIGISPEQRAKLFQPFIQGDTSTSRKFGGTGLGLSICQRLTEMMGGAVGVDSIPGAGSTFWIELPLPIKDARPLTPPAPLEAARVLLVDYDPREAEILEGYLRAGGVTSIQHAPPPGSAIPLTPALDRVDAPIHLVLVNARSGARAVRDLLAELRRHPATSASRDALSAPHLAASIIRADAKSLADTQWLATMTTPVRLRRLWEVVGAALGKVDLTKLAAERIDRMAEYDPPDKETAAREQAVVLVAEDNATNRHVINRLLGRLGYALEFAVDGAEALALLGRGAGRYGILLTDFHMPVMDGFELTRAIRAREAETTGASRLPILALTADVSPDTEKQCLEAGMDGYLRKPIERPALVSALERLLPQALPLRKPRGESAKAAPPSGPARAAGPPVDHAVMADQLGTDDRTEHMAALQAFWESCGSGPDELQANLDAEAAKAARETAHALKGATAMIGASNLSAALKEIEFAARDGDLDRARSRMDDVRAGFQAVHAYLASSTISVK